MNLGAECDANSSDGGRGNAFVGHCVDDLSSTTQSDRIHIFKGYLALYPGLFYARTATGTSTAPMPHLGEVRGHIVLTAFKGPHGGICAGYGPIELTAGNRAPYIENAWDQCDTGRQWDEARANICAAPADTSGAMYTTYLSASCTPPGPAGVAGDGLSTPGLNHRALDGLGNDGATPLAGTGVVLTDCPGSALIGTITAPSCASVPVVSFRAHANGQLVTAEAQGSAPLVASRTAIGPQEGVDLIRR